MSSERRKRPAVSFQSDTQTVPTGDSWGWLAARRPCPLQRKLRMTANALTAAALSLALGMLQAAPCLGETAADAWGYEQLFGEGPQSYSESPATKHDPSSPPPAASEGESEESQTDEPGPNLQTEAPGSDSAPEQDQSGEPDPQPGDEGDPAGPDETKNEPAADDVQTPGPDTAELIPPLITNVFYDTDLRQALSDVAAQAGVTIVPDSTVQGYVTADLVDVPLEDALRMLLASGAFVFRKMEGYYLVGAPDPTNPNFPLLSDTEIVELDYLTADQLKVLLPDIYARYVKFDATGNRVVITAPTALAERIISYIRAVDTCPLQIMIEALVVETSREALREFELAAQHDNVVADTMGGVVTYIEQAQDLLYRVLWLASRDKAVIRANPRVIAQEGQEAKVGVSTEQYFEILTGRVGWEYVRLEQIDVPITLVITPRVAASDRMVTCRIQPEVGDVTGTGPNNLPIITRRTADTTVCVGDGQVIAIGGLLQEVERSTQRKIPLLGDLPLLGGLFRSEQTSHHQREVIIFIVPHILDKSGRFEGAVLFDRLDADEAPGPSK